jgi:hypothetical protein
MEIMLNLFFMDCEQLLILILKKDNIEGSKKFGTR